MVVFSWVLRRTQRRAAAAVQSTVWPKGGAERRGESAWASAFWFVDVLQWSGPAALQLHVECVLCGGLHEHPGCHADVADSRGFHADIGAGGVFHSSIRVMHMRGGGPLPGAAVMFPPKWFDSQGKP
eukprot:jgi/Ulvmu1/1906/UM012_0065.1